MDEKFPPPARLQPTPVHPAHPLYLSSCVDASPPSNHGSLQDMKPLCLLVRTGVGKRQDGMPL